MFNRLILPVLAFGLIVLTISACFYKLGEHSLSVRSDEIVYARVSQEMVHANAWWNLKHGNVNFYNKPPLKMWLTALAVIIGGESNFSYRVVDALCGLILVTILVWAGWKLSDSLGLGLFSGFLILSSLTLFTGPNSFRKCVLDGLLVVLSTLACLSAYFLFEKAKDAGARIYLAGLIGVLLGLAVLVKSVAGLIPLCIFGIYFILSSNRFERLREFRRELALIFILTLILPSFYFLPLLLTNERAWNTLVESEILVRVTKGFNGHHQGDPYYYFRRLFLGSAAMPGYLCVFGLVFGFVKARKDKLIRFLLVWACLPVILYSLSNSRLDWYITPAFPAMALLTSHFLWLTYSKMSCHLILWGLTIRRLSILLVCGLVSASLLNSYYSIFRYIVTEESSRLPIDLFVSSIKKSSSQVVIFRNALSGAANPLKGKFNVDGFYRRMISDRLLLTGEPGKVLEYVRSGVNVVVVTKADLELMPGGEASRTLLPPYHRRKKEVFVLYY